MARNHIFCNKGRVVKFKLRIVTCDHFSSLFHKTDEEKNVEMQETIKKSQGGILKGRAISYLIQNLNQETLIIQEHNSVTDFMSFFGKWIQEER